MGPLTPTINSITSTASAMVVSVPGTTAARSEPAVTAPTEPSQTSNAQRPSAGTTAAAYVPWVLQACLQSAQSIHDLAPDSMLPAKPPTDQSGDAAWAHTQAAVTVDVFA